MEGKLNFSPQIQTHLLKNVIQIGDRTIINLHEMSELNKSSSAKKGRITRLWLTMIKVSDITTALNFYNKILELPVALEAREFNHAEVGPKEPLAKIGLYESGKINRRKKRTGIVFDTDDIYVFYNRLKKQGVRFTLKPTKMPWGGIVADFLDPDNNELEIVQDPNHYKREY